MVLSAPEGVEISAANVNFLIDAGSFTAEDLVTKDTHAKTEAKAVRLSNTLETTTTKLDTVPFFQLRPL